MVEQINGAVVPTFISMKYQSELAVVHKINTHIITLYTNRSASPTIIALRSIPLNMSDIATERWLTALSRIIPLIICTKLYDLVQAILQSSMH